MFGTCRVMPPPSIRRFRFVCAAGYSEKVRERRRRAVAEHLAGWMPLRVIDEHIEGSRWYLWVEMLRPVTRVAATDFARECPGYVPRSFKVLPD